MPGKRAECAGLALRPLKADRVWTLAHAGPSGGGRECAPRGLPDNNARRLCRSGGDETAVLAFIFSQHAAQTALCAMTCGKKCRLAVHFL